MMRLVLCVTSRNWTEFSVSEPVLLFLEKSEEEEEEAFVKGRAGTLSYKSWVSPPAPRLSTLPMCVYISVMLHSAPPLAGLAGYYWYYIELQFGRLSFQRTHTLNSAPFFPPRIKSLLNR